MIKLSFPTMASNSVNTSVDTSANAMNQLYLNAKFFKLLMMLFFKLKISQKVFLGILLLTALITSCSAPKKTAVRHPRQKAPVKETREETAVKEPPAKTEVSEMPEETTVAETRADKVISTARTFIGTPYKYGGTTRSGMDCSGLLINSFRAVDVNLPRSSAAQSQVGKEIKMNDLEPGDLVFFATGRKRKEITHVGLITDVKSKDNIKFIHSSSSLGVVETNLLAEYYQKRFRGARRVIVE